MGDVRDYINNRYEYWHDYAKYHCEKAGMQDESRDVLNETLCDLLEKKADLIDDLYKKKRGTNTELDYYVLRVMKLSITSKTSAYQYKYNRFKTDRNSEINDFDVLDDDMDEDLVEFRTSEIKRVFDNLPLTGKEKDVFSYRYFEDKRITEWTGKESTLELYTICKDVRSAILIILKKDSKKQHSIRTLQIVEDYRVAKKTKKAV
jgi:hypothetical protein